MRPRPRTLLSLASQLRPTASPRASRLIAMPQAPLTPLTRRYASSSPHLAHNLTTPPIPPSPRITLSPPSLSAIREEGFIENPTLLPDATLKITPEAVSQLALLHSREPHDSKLALRLGVDSGGCHGFQYVMELTEERGVDDYVITPEGVAAIPVLVDLISLRMLNGATLHYATELIGSSFRLQDNPQAKEGGNCGCGVSWEAKDMVL